MSVKSRPLMLAAVALLGVGVLWCSRSPEYEVDVVEVVREPLMVQVATNGKVEPVDEFDVRARLDGRIVEILEPGTKVAKGDVVLRIDEGPVSAELAAAQSERLASLDSLREARDRLNRVRKRAATDSELFESGAITAEHQAESQAELKSARRRVAFLEEEVPVRVASLDHRIGDLTAQRKSTTVRAPFAGSVYRREVKKGALVRTGDPLLRLADLERLRVRANVDQVDLGRVKPGQRMVISSNAYPGKRWEARVSEVVPHVVVKESRSVSETLAAIAPPSDGLVPGMTVDVDIMVDSTAAALQIPADAFFLIDGRAFAYRLDGDRVVKTPVKLGRSTVTAVEVLDGLAENDRIIVGSVDGLPDGADVSVRSRVSARE